MKQILPALMALLLPGLAMAQQRPDQLKFRDLYRELVQTDTSITTGDCTLLAGRIDAHLKQAGFTSADITRFALPDHPKEGGLVVVLPGTSRTLKPILLLGHIDVVTAKREDWTRDPYKFIEEKGYYWGRGVADMKGMDAIWIDMLMRFKAEHLAAKRTLKLALTCGEETSTAFNGAEWLAANRRDLIDAQFALNEGGGGRTDGKGKLVTASLHVGEKTPVNFRIEATNPGGHSSAPVRDNAIYELADALAKVRDLEFPLQLTETTRQYFERSGKARGDEMGNAMMALAANPRGQEGRGAGEHGQELPFHAAYYLRRDAARWRPREQRAATARRRQHQLPHLPGRRCRGGAQDAGEGHRRSAHDGEA